MKNSDFVVGKPIPQPDRHAGSDLLRVLVIGLLFATPLLIYVALSVSYMAVEYRISELLSRKEELKRQKALLQLQKEKLLSLSKVAEAAEKELFMVKEKPTEPRLGWNAGLLDGEAGKEAPAQ